jgi:uncharacterized membrane protein YdbT with pleckstrin-like domain
MTEEKTFWKGSPSQWLNLWPFSAAFAIAAVISITVVVVPLAFVALLSLPLVLGYMVWRYLAVKTQTFELTSERLRITRGIINQKIDEVELYRVKDSQMTRTWWMRLTGLASIALETSDRGMPHITIPAIRGGAELREKLRQQVEQMRDKKRVREMDFDNVGSEAGE